ncbi:YkvA family protein [Mycoplana dimorpha]|uniref:Uncharacterized protein DUF1232 n=1 Tax=Mycoplana dimorpha TaxID=28320 RepID=A0A2T5B621_MYCDI|nr:YkvA family protein [Mycoplana dimorpha]PTM94438.1 uncharacterized protein DUF1232 [Mycoplana dimorpha]
MTWIELAKNWARAVKRDVVVLWLAARDPRVPWHAKALGAIVAAYALSPVDLIPDFIPVLGYLDDLIIVPLGTIATLKLIPPDIRAELRTRAVERIALPASRAGMAMIVLVWILLALAVVWTALPMLKGAA